jgi:ABC-type Fe3+-hydroxamate transport system substrate-binding protein
MTQTGVTDALNQTFELGRDYERVVSLVPSLTETLFDLGAGERVVGRTDYCIHPADQVAEVTSVGGIKNPNITAILDLRPDLVLMGQDENQRADADALISADVRVFTAAPHSILDTFGLLWDLAALMGITAEAGPRIQSIERTYDWVRGATESLEPMRVFCPIWRDPWMTLNRDTYTHDLLYICGGENVFADYERRYPSISLEEVAERVPDLILLPSEPFAFSIADAAALKAHTALADKAIRLVDGSLLFWPGTRLAHALAQLPQMLAQ